MKRIAILTDGAAPVSTEMMELMNRGSRYRIGIMPQEYSTADFDTMQSVLGSEGIDFLVLENYSRALPEDFPLKWITIEEGDDVTEASRKLMAACPDYAAEHQWAEALGEEFDESRTVPPPAPAPGEIPPEPTREQRMSSEQQPVQDPRGAAQIVQALANHAAQPAQPAQPANILPPMPNTYMVWAVIATILCSFIPGIVAIVFSSSVSTKYYAGNYEGAKKASDNAQIWIIVSIVLSCIVNTLYLPMMLVAGMG